MSLAWFSWIFGRARIDFTQHERPLKLQRKDGAAFSLSEFCKAATPPCQLNPLLFNGHLQTLWTVLKSPDIPIYYKRRIFQSESPECPGSFAVDFTVPAFDATDNRLPPRTAFFEDDELDALGSDDAKPMVIVLHGLSGGSHEAYLRCVLHPLVDAGWEACVVNSRGCAMSEITSPMLYNSRATWDVRQVVKWVRKSWPNRKLFGIGFSLGANILINYLGEEGDACLFEAAVVCSSPFNLDVGSVALQRSWMGLHVYSRAMGASLKGLFNRHVEQLSRNPRIDIEKVQKITFLHEFDRELQCTTWGYPTEGAYYRDASSCDSLLSVRVPLFAISATDDPIVRKEALPVLEFAQNPYTVLCTTQTGGHLGWFEFSSGKRWFAKPVCEFFMGMATGVKIEPPSEVTAERSGTAVSIVDQTPPYIPTRRKLRMARDLETSQT